MKHYTTIEQSKKLLELGIPAESADMYWFLDPTPAGNIYHLTIQRVDIGVKYLPEYNKGDIPCWSLAALLELMPSSIRIVNTFYGYELYKSTKGYTIDFISTDRKRKLYSFEEESLINAIYSTVCWLLENDYVKKGEEL